MKEKPEDPRRKFLVEALALGLFAGVNLAGVLQPGHAMGSLAKRLPAGKSVYKVKGLVTVDGRAANLETKISASSTIETGRRGEIIFVVGTDAFLMRSNSRLQLSGEGLFIQGMRLLTGKVLSVFGKRKAAPMITTSTATIGIRGTGVYFESDPDKSYICTCYGKTRISANANPDVSLEIATRHHDKPVYVYADASRKKLITKAPVKNHSDAELDLIERLVGRRVPFVNKPGGGY